MHNKQLEYESRKWYLRALPTGNEASKVRFLAKYDHFLVPNVSFLNPYQDANMHRYATTKELKNKAFSVNTQDINQTIGIQVTIMMEIKL